MVNMNIQMKKRDGNSWDNLFPITTSDNVFNKNGVSVTAQLGQTIKLDDSNLTLNNFTEEDRAVIQGLEPGEINAVLGKGNVSTENIGKEQVTPWKLEGYQTSNLLDFNDVIKGTYVGHNDDAPSVPELKNSGTLALSNKIYGEVGESYTVSHVGDAPNILLYFLDENDMITSFVRRPHSDINSHHSFEFPAGSSYFLVNIRVSTIPLEQHFIAKTSELENVDKYKYNWLEITSDNLSKDFVFPNAGARNWYSHKEGKTLVTFGNSRTWYDGKTYPSNSKEPNKSVKGYQSYIREQLGMEVINAGVSGARIHQAVQTLKNYNFTGDEYAISLMHGTNNFNAIESGESGYTFGEVDHTKSGNYDVMSYAGGLQEFVEYVATELPWLKLYLMPDAWCYFSTHGGMPREYSDVVREVAELYHYPFEDVYHKCGFNEHNMDLYFVDGGEHQFHESTKGFERISEIIVPFIANN